MSTSPPHSARPDDGVGVAAAADQVGVAASTLRAWERRYGVRPRARTVGGHRRYSRADIVDLQRMRTLIEAGVTPAHAASLLPAAASRPARTSSTTDAATRFRLAVERRAVTPASRAAARLLRDHGTVDAWTQTFGPYLHALGQQWARTGEAIDCEHVAVAALQSTLRAHATRHASRSRDPQVILAAAPGEHHTLPLDALAAALAERGLGVGVLYDVPGPTLYAAVQRDSPAVVVLWARGRADTGLLRGLVSQVGAVCAAGPAWRPKRLPAHVLHVTGLAAAVETVEARIAALDGTTGEG